MRLRSTGLALGAASMLAASTLPAAPALAAADMDSLVIGIASSPTSLSLSSGYNAYVNEWLYNALYVYDETLSPVPDIAAGPPDISEDGTVWTVKLRDDVYFQPTGERLTAQDVAFTYELANSPDCTFYPSSCLAYVTVTPEGADEPVKMLQRIEVLDDFTVRFTLADAYSLFGTGALPGLWIHSKDAVEAAFARFEHEAADVGAADVDTLLEAGAGSEGFRAAGEALIAAAGLDLPDKALYQTEDGALDEASYDWVLETSLKDLSAILVAEAIDKIAAAYKYLDVAREPVGTGPFYVTEYRSGQDITAARNDRYHHGPAAFENIYFMFIEDDISKAAALAAGDIDWSGGLTADGYRQVEDAPGLKFARYQDFGYFAIQFNLRPGRLFHEKAVRQALAHCFDKEATVTAATGGQGLPIESDIPPASWAYDADLPRYEYDVEKGNRMLEEAGWVDTDGDGVREKDGRPLASHILLRAGKPDRTKFMVLLADQVRDCGFDLTTEEAEFRAVLLPGLSWPLIMTGQDQQWDAYFGGWGTWYDPDPYSLWHSSQCVTEEHPTRLNYICFQNERVDELIEAGQRETDRAIRAEMYREYATILAEELPYLFAWSDEVRDGLRSEIHGTEEWTEEVMSTPTWYWELHKVNKVNPTAPK